ncbi:hypothetical protein GR158_12290 [Shinella sp. AETb1-6]|uniref:hypothetical protein n=1 Tax=Shinella TaxID=323620 RepID=UPI00106EC622|nr:MULTISPECIES: hypothetical protein [Shinella]MCD1264532.1 hypothetical protein [Shinella sumterensis]MXN51902.1 hypothetical protein [Shinella sp. AETb1-6]TFE92817.1 hypothetical protein B5M44_25970 [Shinella sumterensis]
MTDEQFRALRTLILDQNVKIEALALEIRKLKRSIETTEVIQIGPDDIGDRVDMPDDVKRLLGL